MGKYSCEDNCNIPKSDVARLQLEDAIDLFLINKRLSSITLAGAAEEIFARLLKQRGERSVVEESFRVVQEIREKTGFVAMGGRKKSEIFKEWNGARNTLKHHDETDDDTVTINLFDEAYMMIQRALANADKLGVNLRNRHEYENWLVENIY